MDSQVQVCGIGRALLNVKGSDSPTKLTHADGSPCLHGYSVDLDVNFAGGAVTSETVDHPRHYNANPSGIECIEVVEHLNFNRGNAIKYIWRAGEKGGTDKALEDLRKARWYIDREIARLGARSNG